MKRTARSTRFPLAVHIMCMLAVRAIWDKDAYVSSPIMSESTSKSDVSVRQILGLLVKAGLVHSTPGSKGGARLSMDASEITLLHIYRAVEAQNIFSLHDANEFCVIAISVREKLRATFLRAESTLEQELEELLLSDFARDANEALAQSPRFEEHLERVGEA